MSTLKVGLVGLGIMGRNHARVLSNLDGVELLGIVDPIKNAELNSEFNFFELNDLLRGMHVLHCNAPLHLRVL